MTFVNTPLISIITVVHNGVDTLRSTIESILPHLGKDVKYIIIDGGSNDGTLEIIRTYESYLAYWVSESDRGIYDAMNKGWFAAAEGSYILYIGSGDKLISLPSTKKILGLKCTGSPVIMGRCDIGDKIHFCSRWSNEMRLRNTAHHQALMVCKLPSITKPFDIDLKVYADWDFNLRLFLRGVKATYLRDFHAYAEPGGVSWRHNLKEIRVVARRHGGVILGQVAWLLSWVSSIRRTYCDNKRTA